MNLYLACPPLNSEFIKCTKQTFYIYFIIAVSKAVCSKVNTFTPVHELDHEFV